MKIKTETEAGICTDFEYNAYQNQLPTGNNCNFL